MTQLVQLRAVSNQIDDEYELLCTGRGDGRKSGRG